MLVKRAVCNIRKSILKYELSILKAFKRNPYNCPKCDVRMKFFVEIT